MNKAIQYIFAAGLVLAFVLVLASKAQAENCQTISIDKAGMQFAVKNVTFPRKDETKKYCFKLPKPQNPSGNPIVEFSTVNKGNASCGLLEMKVIRPNKPDITGAMSPTKCKSEAPSPQPGCTANYTVGKWVVKYTLRDYCKPGQDTWDLNGKWAIK